MQRFYTVEALKEKTIMHVFQFKHTFRQLGELTFCNTFWKSKMLHCNLIIDEKPDVLDGAQAHMDFPYNAWRTLWNYVLFKALQHLANTKFIEFIGVFKHLFCSLWDFTANKYKKRCKKRKLHNSAILGWWCQVTALHYKIAKIFIKINYRL